MKSSNRPPASDNGGTEIIDSGRRGMFAIAAAAPLLLLGLGTRAGAAGQTCFDPNTLPAAQKSLRRALNFKVESIDAKKKCGACSFYKPPAGSCGKCDILTGGTVAATSVCDSFAPRA